MIDGRTRKIDSKLIKGIEVSMVDDSNYINKLDLTNYSKVRVVRNKILGYQWVLLKFYKYTNTLPIFYKFGSVFFIQFFKKYDKINLY